MARHKWAEAGHRYKHRCVKCGMVRLKIPHPYNRRWFTEFSRGTFSQVDGATPACGETMIAADIEALP